MKQGFRNSLEGIFAALARGLYRHPFKTLFLTFSFIAVLLSFIPHTTIDTSAVALLRQTDPARIHYNEFRDQFGDKDMIIIAVTGPNIFDQNFLTRLKELHRDIENQVPYLKKVNSLINARHTYGQGDTLVVEDLLEHWPRTPKDLEELEQTVSAVPFYQNSLISENRQVTTLVLETQAVISEPSSSSDTTVGDALLDGFEAPEGSSGENLRYFSEKENQQVVAALNKLVALYQAKDFSLALAGDPVVLDVYNRAMEKDIVKAVVLSLFTIGIFLALLFQRVSGVVLPEIIIMSALFSIQGLLAMFNISIKLTTIVLPGFLLAVGVGFSVHILSIFYLELQKGNCREDAIATAMAHSGLAVVLTALTTAASLFTFAFSDLTAIGDLGLFGALGVILALVYTILLLPAFVSLIPITKKPGEFQEKKSKTMDAVLLTIARFSMGHPWKIMTGTLVLFLISIYFTCQLTYSHNILNWIPKDKKIHDHVAFIDKELGGSVILEVILDFYPSQGSNLERAGKNQIKDPLVLEKVQSIIQELGTYEKDGIRTGKVFSINEILMEVNQSLYDNDPLYYALAKTGNGVSQELLLFENSGAKDLERLVDSGYGKTRISIKIPWTDAIYLAPFIDHVKALFDRDFSDQARVVITGIPAILARSIPASLHSMAKSYAMAFVVICLLMIVHVGSVKIGLLSMISNLLPILMTTGIMGMMGIRLDMSTIMIGSIAIGIVVDDTLHFMYNFRKFFEQTGDVQLAVEQTMLGTGRALLLTSLILSSGFFILMTASLTLMVVFGALTGMTILLALATDFIVNPALMCLVTKSLNKGN